MFYSIYQSNYNHTLVFHKIINLIYYYRRWRHSRPVKTFGVKGEHVRPSCQCLATYFPNMLGLSMCQPSAPGPGAPITTIFMARLCWFMPAQCARRCRSSGSIRFLWHRIFGKSYKKISDKIFFHQFEKGHLVRKNVPAICGFRYILIDNTTRNLILLP